MQTPDPMAGPRRTTLLQHVARAVLRAFGWRSIFVPPPAPRGIIIVYPHTSNWDFIIGLLYKFGTALPAHWVGKDTLFRWPVRGVFKRFGGIPINRRERSGFVETILEEFRQHDWMWLALAPEGTRSRRDHWKSGFYRIALAGQLPVGLGFIDYATRCVGIDTYVIFTGDRERDMAFLREFYADKHGGRPEDASDIRLRD